MIISINPFFYICFLICIITGYIKYFTYIMIIIIIHELGHILCSKLFKWKIDKIILLPFGGLILYNDLIDKKLYEELLVTISGPLVQFIFTLFINNMDFKIISYTLLLFNLLPILPLDGSKILNILLNKFLNFKKSYYISIIVSILFIILIFRINLILILVILCLIKSTIESCYKYKYIYNKFLLEKYLYKNKYKKIKVIDNIYNMYRNKIHFIKYNNKIVKEDDILSDIYKKLKE